MLFVCETEEIRGRLANMLEAVGSGADRPRFSVKLVSEYVE